MRISGFNSGGLEGAVAAFAAGAWAWGLPYANGLAGRAFGDLDLRTIGLSYISSAFSYAE